MSGELKPQHLDVVNEYLESVKQKKANAYMLTISRDGESPVRTIIFYTNAIEAAEAYNMYNDWGFAKQYLTVTLYEPSGNINQKVFKRNQAGDPTFLRQNYIDVTESLLQIKNLIDYEAYKELCLKMTKSFSKDNWRFDPERFLHNLGINHTLDS